MRGEEHDRDPARRFIEAQLSDQLVAVHDRHEDVRNDEVWTFSLHQGQSLLAIDSLEQTMALITQQRDQEVAIRVEVVNNQDCRHRGCSS